MLNPDKQALKKATRDLVGAAHGQERAVKHTRLSRPAMLSDYASVEHHDRYIPVDVVADLEAVTQGYPGAPHVTRELARQAGFVLVPLPRAQGEAEPFCSYLPRIIRESSDVTMRLSGHLGDGARITPADAAALRREIAECIQVLVDLDAALEGVGQ